MKASFLFKSLIAILILYGCSYNDNEFFVGEWVNEHEKCTITLNEDLTFVSHNLPLDISNSYYLMKDKAFLWEGHWQVEDDQIKLYDKECYYYLNINSTLLSKSISVKLLEESGDEVIYFEKI